LIPDQALANVTFCSVLIFRCKKINASIQRTFLFRESFY